MVNKYSRRELTFDTDILDAFKGILRAFESLESPVQNLCGVPLYSLGLSKMTNTDVLATMENAAPLSVRAEFMDGGNAGFAAAAVVERFLVQQAVASSLEHMADQSARNKLYRRIAGEDEVAQIRRSEEMYEWQQDLEEVHDALHLQYAQLITAHSELLNRNRDAR
ncbi:hypothetical protein Neosp_013937 [[Neocosmospora] mangrovei]